MKLFVFERSLYEDLEEFTKKINDWVNLHREIEVVDYDFGYENDGVLKTVMVKWK